MCIHFTPKICDGIHQSQNFNNTSKNALDILLSRSSRIENTYISKLKRFHFDPKSLFH